MGKGGERGGWWEAKNAILRCRHPYYSLALGILGSLGKPTYLGIYSFTASVKHQHII